MSLFFCFSNKSRPVGNHFLLGLWWSGPNGPGSAERRPWSVEREHLWLLLTDICCCCCCSSHQLVHVCRRGGGPWRCVAGLLGPLHTGLCYSQPEVIRSVIKILLLQQSDQHPRVNEMFSAIILIAAQFIWRTCYNIYKTDVRAPPEIHTPLLHIRIKEAVGFWWFYTDKYYHAVWVSDYRSGVHEHGGPVQKMYILCE